MSPLVNKLISLNVIDDYNTAFIHACAYGHIEIIMILLSFDIKNYRQAFEAAFYDNLYIAEWLTTLTTDIGRINENFIKYVYKNNNFHTLKLIISNMEQKYETIILNPDEDNKKNYLPRCF